MVNNKFYKDIKTNVTSKNKKASEDDEMLFCPAKFYLDTNLDNDLGKLSLNSNDYFTNNIVNRNKVNTLLKIIDDVKSLKLRECFRNLDDYKNKYGNNINVSVNNDIKRFYDRMYKYTQIGCCTRAGEPSLSNQLYHRIEEIIVTDSMNNGGSGNRFNAIKSSFNSVENPYFDSFEETLNRLNVYIDYTNYIKKLRSMGGTTKCSDILASIVNNDGAKPNINQMCNYKGSNYKSAVGTAKGAKKNTESTHSFQVKELDELIKYLKNKRKIVKERISEWAISSTKQEVDGVIDRFKTSSKTKGEKIEKMTSEKLLLLLQNITQKKILENKDIPELLKFMKKYIIEDKIYEKGMMLQDFMNNNDNEYKKRNDKVSKKIIEDIYVKVNKMFEENLKIIANQNYNKTKVNERKNKMTEKDNEIAMLRKKIDELTKNNGTQEIVIEEIIEKKTIDVKKKKTIAQKKDDCKSRGLVMDPKTKRCRESKVGNNDSKSKKPTIAEIRADCKSRGLVMDPKTKECRESKK